MSFASQYQLDVFKSLAENPAIFTQRGRLVEVSRRPKATIVPLSSGSMNVHMTQSPHWKLRMSQTQGTALPPGLFNHIRTSGHWPGVRPINGIVDTPVLRADGTLLDAPGYDAASQLFLDPAGTFDLPDAPTQSDATRALALLTRRFAALPFESDAHRSAFLAALLTPLARGAIDGAAPLFFFDAPNAATPSLLADCIGLLTNGRAVIKCEKPASETRFRRLLARTQAQGEHLVLLRGAETYRSGDALRTALFAEGWIDGLERTTDPRPITWFAASANALLSRDVASLVLPIRLRATEDDVTGASWAPPPEFTRDLRRDRTQLVSAALTILRAHELAGRPDPSGLTWSGFEAWSSRIAAALVWAGATSPLRACASAAHSVDDDTPELRALIDGLAAIPHIDRGLNVHVIIAEAIRRSTDRDALRHALDTLVTGDWREPRCLAAFLKKHRGRRLNGLLLDHAGEDANGYARWLVRRPESPESETANETSTRLGARSVPAAASDIETSTDSGPPERRDPLPQIQHTEEIEHADRPGPRSVSAAASDIETSTDSGPPERRDPLPQIQHTEENEHADRPGPRSVSAAASDIETSTDSDRSNEEIAPHAAHATQRPTSASNTDEETPVTAAARSA